MKTNPVRISLAVFVTVAVLLGAALLSAAGLPAVAGPQRRPLYQGGAPTVVSYQGQVTVDGTPWNTTGYFKFAIMDSATGDGTTNYWANDNTASGQPAASVSLTVANGLFNVLLGDTGMTALPATAFDGTERYLRVWFSTDDSTFTPLDPNRRIAAVPYALQAEEALNAWRLTGNAGTTPGTYFLGTTDNVALEFHVNGARALRLEPHSISPNVIGGYSGNWVTSGVRGATIGGGGYSATSNRVTDRYGTVGGGGNNQAGNNNVATDDATYATVGGGYHNIASSVDATVGGGTDNTASGWYATVPGGHSNTAQGLYSFAAGRRAKANHQGAFVWADSTDANFASTANDQFSVRASGGVNFTTGAAPFLVNGNAFAVTGTVWSLGGNAGTTPGADYLGTSDAVSLTLATNGTAAVRIDTAGNVGLGTNSPAERLTVRGNALVLGEDNPVAQGFTSANLSYPDSVFVSGSYAYVASYDNGLVIFDISDPTNPVTTSLTSTNLQGSVSVFVSGSYAYVASWENNRLAIFDISDPTNPVDTSFTTASLDGPDSVFVAGRYAYVASRVNNRLVIFDISDPANPVVTGYTSTNLYHPNSVFVVGRYAYVLEGIGELTVVDVSDPANPVPTGSTSTNLDGASSVFVSGRYAYVTSWNNDRLVIFDISDPANPVATGRTSANLDAPGSVFVAGRYAYVTSSNNDRLAVFDISDPANPVAQGFTSSYLDAPSSVFVAGRYAYVTSSNNSRLAVFAVNNLEAPAGEVGSLQAGDLQVSDNARVGNDLHVQGSLNVGPGGALVGGDLGVEGDLRVVGSTIARVTTVFASTTLTVKQSGVVLVNNGAAATITLPAAASAEGVTFTIKRLTANAVTVDTAGGKIDGDTSQTLAARYDFITVVSNGFHWWIISH
ncbi:MAG: hypothetical protein KKA73_01870 [Chloroflexi bacterium]|nr:hypothetical protein [Chloroflexota bacterium]MBU1746413.1 hypothetical protein [Chloroflexota bacterium]